MTCTIPWTAKNDYALRYRLSENEFEDFLKIMDHLDVVYLEWMSSK